MAENKNYKAVVSGRAKRMPGTHMRFMTQVSKEAAAKREEIMAALRSLYQIQDETVYVDYILDCRKDYSWLIH